MAVEPHVGDIGTIIIYTIKDGDTILDISGATTKELIIENSGGGSRVVLEGEFATDGTDGVIEFTSQEGTWDVAGISKEQVYLVLPDGEWRSDVVQRTIGPAL
jgi:hypothetical protein